MDFITVTSIGGSIWSFRKTCIEMVSKKFRFSEQELKDVPELNGRDSCAVIRLAGENVNFFCQDSYESIMERLEEGE